MVNCKTLKDTKINGKNVIVRLDLNVPIKDGKITDNKRIVASLPTLKFLLENGCKIIVLSHLSRIKSLDDIKSGKKSLAPVANEIERLLDNASVRFLPTSTGQDVVNAVKHLNEGEILVLENTRYNDVNAKGEVVKLESKCNPELGKFWASLGQVFVNDAFGTCHRRHASNVGIAENIESSCVGFLVENELKNLLDVCENPKKPFVAIIGGAKVSDKLKVINRLIEIADKVLIGGGMVFTFQKADGHDIGLSLVEEDMIEEAQKILAKGRDKLIIASDYLCAEKFEDQPGEYRDIKSGLKGVMGLDIGKDTIENFNRVLNEAKTVIWNGPAGVFEFTNYQIGTTAICQTLKEITARGAFTVIGGGDSAAAAIALGFEETDFSFISTGGGASLALIEGSPLPGIEAIEKK